MDGWVTDKKEDPFYHRQNFTLLRTYTGLHGPCAECLISSHFPHGAQVSSLVLTVCTSPACLHLRTLPAVPRAPLSLLLSFPLNLFLVPPTMHGSSLLSSFLKTTIGKTVSERQQFRLLPSEKNTCPSRSLTPSKRLKILAWCEAD